MLITVISDIHDNLPNLKTCLDWSDKNKIKKIIVCGDLTTQETISHLARTFRGEIFMVAGNAELYEPTILSKFKNIKYFGTLGLIQIDKLNIGLCHEPDKIKKVQKATVSSLDFIFYGHTHKPWLEKSGETFIVNPGNLAGDFNPATFALLDTSNKKISLKILNEL